MPGVSSAVKRSPRDNLLRFPARGPLCGECHHGLVTVQGVHCQVFSELILVESTARDCELFDTRSYIPPDEMP